MNSVDHSFIPHFPAEATNRAFVGMEKIKRAYSETWRLTNSQTRNSQTQNFLRRPISGAMQIFSMDLSFVLYHLLSSFLLCEALDLENWNISIEVFELYRAIGRLCTVNTASCSTEPRSMEAAAGIEVSPY